MAKELKVMGLAFMAVLLIVALIALGMAVAKLGGYLFDLTPDLDHASLQICTQRGGTPVLEDHGQSYKTCAINGKSNTENYVKH